MTLNADGIPVTCDEVKAIMERMIRCTDIPQAQRDQMATVLPQSVEIWHSTPPEKMAALAETCRSANAHLRAGVPAGACP